MHWHVTDRVHAGYDAGVEYDHSDYMKDQITQNKRHENTEPNRNVKADCQRPVILMLTPLWEVGWTSRPLVTREVLEGFEPDYDSAL